MGSVVRALGGSTDAVEFTRSPGIPGFETGFRVWMILVGILAIPGFLGLHEITGWPGAIVLEVFSLYVLYRGIAGAVLRYRLEVKGDVVSLVPFPPFAGARRAFSGVGHFRLQSREALFTPRGMGTDFLFLLIVPSVKWQGTELMAVLADGKTVALGQYFSTSERQAAEELVALLNSKVDTKSIRQ